MKAHASTPAWRRVWLTLRMVAAFLWWNPIAQRLRRIGKWVLLVVVAEAVFAVGSAIAVDRHGSDVGPRIFWSLAALLVLIVVRRPLWRAIRSMRVKSRFRRAVVDAKLITERKKVPAAYRMWQVPAGDRLLVGVPSGMSVDDLERCSERLAVTMGARQVRVIRRPDDARLADVVVVRRDPLIDLAGEAWPWRDAQQTSLWHPVPVGVDEDGKVVELTLPERNVLLGGEPGAGKSAALSLLVAAAALDPTAKLWLLDGKLVELASWAPVAERSVGVEVDQAVGRSLTCKGSWTSATGPCLRHGDARSNRATDCLCMSSCVTSWRTT